MEATERRVYLNGKMVPEKEAKISVFDIGFMYGATIYESLRTFKHKPFKLDEHLRRFEGSLQYVGLESLITKEEMARIIENVIAANIHLTDKDDDMWLSGEVTPGVGFPHPLVKQKDKRPSVIVYSTPIPHAEYARYYTEGKHAITANVRNVSPQTLDCRVKDRSQIHFFIAKQEALSKDPDAFGLLFDIEGNISEATGANFFIVTDNTLYTSTTRNILIGISRQTAIELATNMNLPVVETDINLYDVYNADEAFFTTSSYCILPVSQVNGVSIGKTIPGVWTDRLLGAWSEMVGVDIVRQAQKFAKSSR